MCRPTWYALALFACIVLLPAASPGATLPMTQVRAVGTVTRVLPDGFTIVLDRARSDHSVVWAKDPITVTRSGRTRLVAQSPRDGATVRVGAVVEVTGESWNGNGAAIAADLVRILAAAAPAPAPAPRGMDAAAGFTFDDMRVQSVQRDGAPGVTRVKTGTKFYPFAYVTIPHAHGETYFVTFSVQFEGKPPIEAYHDSQRVPVIVNETARLSFSNGMRAKLAAGLEAQNITILGRITSQDATRTRSASFVLVR
jgi:hypothetical protein